MQWCIGGASVVRAVKARPSMATPWWCGQQHGAVSTGKETIP